MNPLKKLAGQTAIYGLPTIFGRLLSYFLTPLYTYNLDKKGDFGTITEMYAYTSFLMVILTYGLETALFNFARKEENKEKVYSTAFISIISTTLLFTVFMFSSRQFWVKKIGYQNHPEYITWFICIIAFDTIAAIVFAKLRQQNKAKRFALVNSIVIVCNIALNFFFIIICKNAFETQSGFFKDFYNPSVGVVGYAFISTLIASALKIILLMPELVRLNYQFDLGIWKNMLNYSFPLLIAGLAGMTNETMDRILLKYLLPADVSLEQLGVYGACYKISIIMTIFIQTFRYAAEPFFFSQANQKNSANLYSDIMKYFVIVCSFIFLGTMMNISWIQYFVGPEFREGMGVVPILLIANLCLGIFYNLSIWYKLSGKTQYGAYLTIFGAVITLTLNFYWIPRIGYIGSAFATLICYASMTVASYIIGQKHYKIDYNLKQTLGYFGLSLILYFLSSYLRISDSVMHLIINNSLLLFFGIFIFFNEKRLKVL